MTSENKAILVDHQYVSDRIHLNAIYLNLMRF